MTVTIELMRVLPSGGLSSFCDSRIGFNFAGSLNDLFDRLDFPARSLEARERLNMVTEMPPLTKDIKGERKRAFVSLSLSRMLVSREIRGRRGGGDRQRSESDSDEDF